MIADVNSADLSENPTTNRKLRQIPLLLEVSMCVLSLVVIRRVSLTPHNHGISKS